MTSYRYIAIEGLIGAGKTTLAKRLATEWNATLVLEGFEENAFLPDFYKDPERHAFAVELSFLAQRYHQLKRVGELSLFRPMSVSDYSIGKSLVFASVTLPADEATLFRELYGIIYNGLPKPDLLVYLHVPIEKLHERIRSRGRFYEQGIQDGYLERLQESYLDHLRKLAGVRVLVLDVGGKDLLYDPVAYRYLLDLVAVERPIGHFVEHL